MLATAQRALRCSGWAWKHGRCQRYCFPTIRAMGDPKDASRLQRNFPCCSRASTSAAGLERFAASSQGIWARLRRRALRPASFLVSRRSIRLRCTSVIRSLVTMTAPMPSPVLRRPSRGICCRLRTLRPPTGSNLRASHHSGSMGLATPYVRRGFWACARWLLPRCQMAHVLPMSASPTQGPLSFALTAKSMCRTARAIFSQRSIWPCVSAAFMQRTPFQAVCRACRRSSGRALAAMSCSWSLPRTSLHRLLAFCMRSGFPKRLS